MITPDIPGTVREIAFESGATVAVVDELEQELGARPAAVLADSAHGTGVNLTALAARGIAAYIPPAGEVTAAANPAPCCSPRFPKRRWPPRVRRHRQCRVPCCSKRRRRTGEGVCPVSNVLPCIARLGI